MPSFFTTKKIKPPKSLGDALKKKRRRLSLSLRDVEKTTKIKRIYLVAIERSRWGELPSEVYVAGFLNTYSKTLKLDAKKILRRFKEEHKTHELIHGEKIENPKEIRVRRLFFTPRLLAIIIAITLALGFGGYLWFQISGFAAAPNLEISNPSSQEVKTSEQRIEIKGKTNTDSSISLNNEPIPVNTSGEFVQQVSLQKGINVLEIVSTNKAGKKATKVIQVMVE